MPLVLKDKYPDVFQVYGSINNFNIVLSKSIILLSSLTFLSGQCQNLLLSGPLLMGWCWLIRLSIVGLYMFLIELNIIQERAT